MKIKQLDWMEDVKQVGLYSESGKIKGMNYAKYKINHEDSAAAFCCYLMVEDIDNNSKNLWNACIWHKKVRLSGGIDEAKQACQDHYESIIREGLENEDTA